jgi:uncharacterized tellurite resistance protein B-like protein
MKKKGDSRVISTQESRLIEIIRDEVRIDAAEKDKLIKLAKETEKDPKKGRKLWSKMIDLHNTNRISLETFVNIGSYSPEFRGLNKIEQKNSPK